MVLQRASCINSYAGSSIAELCLHEKKSRPKPSGSNSGPAVLTAAAVATVPAAVAAALVQTPHAQTTPPSLLSTTQATQFSTEKMLRLYRQRD
jgi:hypothetical protein